MDVQNNCDLPNNVENIDIDVYGGVLQFSGVWQCQGRPHCSLL